jgi:acyl carrier protein
LEPEPARIELELREILHELYEIPPEQLEALESGSALFGDGLGLDSLDSMPLVIAIEDRFGVTLQNDATTRKAFASLGGLSRHIAGLLAGRSA